MGFIENDIWNGRIAILIVFVATVYSSCIIIAAVGIRQCQSCAWGSGCKFGYVYIPYR